MGRKVMKRPALPLVREVRGLMKRWRMPSARKRLPWHATGPAEVVSFLRSRAANSHRVWINF